MRISTIGSLLVLSLTISADAQEQSPRKQVTELAAGSKVAVELKDGRGFRGRLGVVTETQFRLDPLTPGEWPSRDFLFQDVSKIRSEEQSKWHIVLEGAEYSALIPIVLVGCGLAALFRQPCDWFGY